uniref:hypothetical protein n=1 Tax=Candidatus Enterococcus willemsii TaxID=1857215 RepID=UPI00403F8CB1
MKKVTALLGTLFLASLPIIGGTTTVYGATINPAVEIKYNLDPAQFSKEQIKTTFSAQEDEHLKVYFFDTEERTFFANNAIQRLRVYEGKDKFDITYKIRFQDLSLEEATAELANHGFTGSESNYKFEIDSKNGQDPLSVSRKEKIKNTKQISYDFVDAKAALQAVQDNAPKKIKEWVPNGWFNLTLQNSKMTEPANVQTYVGSYQGIPAEIEYWEYQGQTMIELSTKTTQDIAPQIKTTWQTELELADFLSTDQRGKTNFVLFSE